MSFDRIRRVKVGDLEVAFREEGGGEPLVLPNTLKPRTRDGDVLRLAKRAAGPVIENRLFEGQALLAREFLPLDQRTQLALLQLWRRPVNELA